MASDRVPDGEGGGGDVGSSGGGAGGAARPPPKSEIIGKRERAALYGFFAVVVVVLGIMQSCAANHQSDKYDRLLVEVREANVNQRINGASYVISSEVLAAADDAMAMRHACVFLGFVVIAIGCIIVVTGIESGYQINLADGARSASMKTASPGLVLITLGVVLVIAALYRTTKFWNDGEPESTPAATSGSGPSKPIELKRSSSLPPPPDKVAAPIDAGAQEKPQ